MSNEDRLREVAEKLYLEVYEEAFRGKDRGRFCLTRSQLKNALGVQRLHASTIQRLQDIALEKGLVIIDLDDLFPCVEVRIIRRYRRPPAEIFARIFPQPDDEEDKHEEDDD